MSVRSGQSITVEFITSSFSTGAATNADSTPTGTLVVNGTDNAASVTVTNVDTGRYKAAVTLPTLAVGDVVELSVAATVSTVAGKGVVWRDTKDVLLDSSGNITFNNTSLSGAVGSVTAGVTVTTNNDKTGYSLTQTFPTNFSSLAITAGGAITIGTNSDKTGYSLIASYDPSKTASQAGDAMTLTSAYDFAKGTVAMTESYAADGATFTPAQALYEICQALTEFIISSTTITVKKRDGSTTAMTYTLDSATTPTSRTRAT